MTEPKKDLREQITDRIVASLESGVMPWRKGWSNEGGVAAGLPRNAVSGRIYSGGNRLMLMMQGMDKGYADPRWLTYKQAASLGGGVTQGEKSTPIEYWDELLFIAAGMWTSPTTALGSRSQKRQKNTHKRSNSPTARKWTPANWWWSRVEPNTAGGKLSGA
jgi:hypothetical protein